MRIGAFRSSRDRAARIDTGRRGTNVNNPTGKTSGNRLSALDMVHVMVFDAIPVLQLHEHLAVHVSVFAPVNDGLLNGTGIERYRKGAVDRRGACTNAGLRLDTHWSPHISVILALPLNLMPLYS